MKRASADLGAPGVEHAAPVAATPLSQVHSLTAHSRFRVVVTGATTSYLRLRCGLPALLVVSHRYFHDLIPAQALRTGTRTQTHPMNRGRKENKIKLAVFFAGARPTRLSHLAKVVPPRWDEVAKILLSPFSQGACAGGPFRVRVKVCAWEPSGAGAWFVYHDFDAFC